MNPAEHYAAAEELLVEGVRVVHRIAAAAADKRLDHMDDLGKKAMGIWAQAQVHATLARVDPDTARLAPQRPIPVVVPQAD